MHAIMTQSEKHHNPVTQSLHPSEWLPCKAQLQRRGLKNDELRFKEDVPKDGSPETIVGLDAAEACCAVCQHPEEVASTESSMRSPY